jgi:hypothetical protein
VRAWLDTVLVSADSPHSPEPRDRERTETATAGVHDPATVADDPNWTALITAPYPDHVSGHLGLDSSHTGVLRMFFGDAPAGGYQITSASALLTASDPKTRSFTGFNQAVNEIVEARIWAGLHYRTADVQAVELGTNVANFAAANYFESVGNH